MTETYKTLYAAHTLRYIHMKNTLEWTDVRPLLDVICFDGDVILKTVSRKRKKNQNKCTREYIPKGNKTINKNGTTIKY